MSTDRQKSFTARLSYNNYAVCFYELSLYAEPVTGYFRGHLVTVDGTKGFAGLKPSQYLCLNNKLYANEGELLYFRYRDGKYVIYVREQGPHYGKVLDQSNGWLLAAENGISFNLVDPNNHNQVLTLDDFPGATSKELCIQSNRGLIQDYDYVACDHSFSHSYLVTHGGKKSIPFNFEIVETNVLYVGNPEEG